MMDAAKHPAPLPPFALERWMTAYETKVRYDLAESGICPMTAAELLALDPDPAARMRELGLLSLGYSEARGTEELRDLLAALYHGTTSEDVLVTTGAIEANYLVFRALLRPGDGVVTLHPGYQQLHSVPESIGCAVRRLELREKDGYRYDLDRLRALVDDRTRLIVINTPHNPTGAILTAAECAAIYALAEAHDAYILSDEAYRWLQLDEPLAPPLRDLGPRAISVGTLSKAFGLPGLRVGWIASTAAIVAACWAIRDYTSLSPNRLSDFLACRAVERRTEVAARTNAISRENRATLRRFVHERADLLSWVEPRGGLVAMLRYHMDVPSYAVASQLADEASVMLAPGAAFGLEHRLRIGIGPRPEAFLAGLERLDAFLRRLRRDAAPAGAHERRIAGQTIACAADS